MAYSRRPMVHAKWYMAIGKWLAKYHPWYLRGSKNYNFEHQPAEQISIWLGGKKSQNTKNCWEAFQRRLFWWKWPNNSNNNINNNKHIQHNFPGPGLFLCRPNSSGPGWAVAARTPIFGRNVCRRQKVFFRRETIFILFCRNKQKADSIFFCQSDLLELEPSQRNETKKVEIEKKKERNTFFASKLEKMRNYKKSWFEEIRNDSWKVDKKLLHHKLSRLSLI